MRIRTTAGVAAVSALSLILTACSSSGGGDNNNSSGAPGGSDSSSSGPVEAKGAVTIALPGEPQNPIIPSNTNETDGSTIIHTIMSGLVDYDPKTAEPVNDLAESITPSNNQKTFTIKVRKGVKFSDGSDLKAKNFVDAWNWAAYGPNAQLDSSFFAPIDGFADVNPTDPDGDGPKKAPAPTAKTMKGLKLVDDYTFTVDLSDSMSVFPTTLGYICFYPLPDSFFADNGKSFPDNPVGTGPFKFVSHDKDKQWTFTVNPNYSGPFKPHVKDVTFRVYTTVESAYTDLLSDQVDAVTSIPDDSLVGEKYKQDLGDRALDAPLPGIQTITFPSPKSGDHTYDNPDLRKAISLAIDRKTITHQIFNDTRQPASDWTTPALPGYKEGLCTSCNYDPDAAKAELQKAGGFKGTMTLSYNGDGGHKAWTEAVCNSIKNALGVACQATPVPTFAAFRTEITSKKMKGMFRTGWLMDYPAIQDFLEPLYKTGASSNDGDYSSKEFDDLLAQANTESADQAIATYQQAEGVLDKDMPVIPLWYYSQQGGYSSKVDNVRLTPFNEIDLSTITAK